MRHLLCATVALALTSALTAATAHGQAYPGRSVRVIVGFSAGPPDTVARLLSQQLTTRLGHPFVVENRVGANGMLGADTVAKAAPDGYTVLITSSSYAINPGLTKRMPFDPLADLAPVTNIAEYDGLFLVINPSLPVRTLAEFIAYAKRADTKLSYGTPGVGNSLHLATAVFNKEAGLNAVHVPYRGAAPAITGLMGGEIQMMLLPPPAALPLIADGKLRALAFNHAKRLPALPDVPTMAEAGLATLDVGGSNWSGMLVPAKTPAAVVDRLQREVRAAVFDPQLKQRFAALNIDPVANTPDEFRKSLEASIKRYRELVALAGIEPN